MILSAAALLLAAEATPSPTPAPSAWSLSVSEQGLVRDWQVNPRSAIASGGYDDLMNRLYLLLTRPGVEAGLQVDLAGATPNDNAGLTGPGTPPALSWSPGLLAASGAVSGPAYALVVEKKFLRLRAEGAALQLGDSYRSVGRGLALSLVKNQQLDIDTSIEGGMADYSTEGFDASAWAGYSNPQTISSAFPISVVKDPRDQLAGGRISGEGEGVEIATFGSGIRFDPSFPGSVILGDTTYVPTSAFLGGSSLSIPDVAGAGSFYLEWVDAAYDGVATPAAGPKTSQTLPGHGAYLEASYQVGRLRFTLEGKDYKNLQVVNIRQGDANNPYPYSVPPTLEKENVVDTHSGEELISNDLRGGRLTAAERLKSGTILRLTYAHFEDDGEALYGTPINTLIEHAYAQVERHWGPAYFQATAGLRYETPLARPSEHPKELHADLDLLMPVGGERSIEVKYLAYHQWDYAYGPTEDFPFEYDTDELVANYRPAHWLSLAGLLDYTTDSAALAFPGHPGNLSRYAYGGGELTVEPDTKTQVRLFAGANKGGLKCSGGTCRFVPAFNGVRLEWATRF